MEKKNCSVCTIVTIVLGVLAALSAIATAVYFLSRHFRRRSCCDEYIAYDCCEDSLEDGVQELAPEMASDDEPDGE